MNTAPTHTLSPKAEHQERSRIEVTNVHSASIERRSGVDRRRWTLSAFWRGAFTQRRRSGRRASDQAYAFVDVHPPRVLAPVLLILGLCAMDGVLTVFLMSHGAAEINPLMALLLPHSLGWFAAVKLGLTALGVFVLVACSQMRVFRGIRGEVFLYAVVACYLALVVYELRMLERLPLGA